MLSKLSTKNTHTHTHNLKAENLADKTENLSPGHRLSDRLEKLFKGVREEPGYIGVFATKTR